MDRAARIPGTDGGARAGARVGGGAANCPEKGFAAGKLCVLPEHTQPRPGEAHIAGDGGESGCQIGQSVHRAASRFEAGPLSGMAGDPSEGTGPESVRAAYKRAGVAAEVRAFFNHMGTAWGAATVAVSRSGAGSVGEAWAAKVPTLFMPYPYHRDQHQRLNAKPMEDAGACVIATDRIDPVKNAESAGAMLESLMTDEPRRAAISRALALLGPADGAARVAAALLAQ